MDCPRHQNRCLYLKFCMKNGITLSTKLVILKVFEDEIVEELGAELVPSSKYCYTANHPDRGIE